MTTNPNGYTATATIRDTSGNVLCSHTFNDEKWLYNSIMNALCYIGPTMASIPAVYELATGTVTADDGREWVFTCVRTAEVRK